jgi:hypothetical protein
MIKISCFLLELILFEIVLAQSYKDKISDVLIYRELKGKSEVKKTLIQLFHSTLTNFTK